MEKFYLEEPTLNRKEEIIELINEYLKYNSDFNGLGPLINYTYGLSIEEAIKECTLVQKEEYAKKINRLPSITYLLIRDSDNKIIGALNIRHKTSYKDLLFIGHIGYSIRPTERNKGYNKINLFIGLIKAKELNIDKIIIVCEPNNIPSNKTIIDLGGILEKTEVDPSDNLLTNIYQLNTIDSINKYKNIYKQYLK